MSKIRQFLPYFSASVFVIVMIVFLQKSDGTDNPIDSNVVGSVETIAPGSDSLEISAEEIRNTSRDVILTVPTE